MCFKSRRDSNAKLSGWVDFFTRPKCLWNKVSFINLTSKRCLNFFCVQSVCCCTDASYLFLLEKWTPMVVNYHHKRIPCGVHRAQLILLILLLFRTRQKKPKSWLNSLTSFSSRIENFFPSFFFVRPVFHIWHWCRYRCRHHGCRWRHGAAAIQLTLADAFPDLRASSH